MGLVDDKKSIFAEIGAYVSMIEQQDLSDPTNLFPSINNKKDAIAFMLDLLKTTEGADALRNTTGEVMTKFVTKVEPSLKKTLKKQTTQSNASDPLPTGITKHGITVPVAKLDIYGKYKNSPISSVGNVTYDTSKPSFDVAAYNAISNPGTEVTFGNVTIEYDEDDDTFTIKPVVTTSTNIGSFFNDFIDALVIISVKEFTTAVMNALYGTIIANQNRTKQQIEDEVKATVFIEKMINETPDIALLPNDMFFISNKVDNLMNGISMLDVGCGVLQASLPLSGLTDAVQNLSGNTNPFEVTNQYIKTFDQSLATTQNTEVANNNRQAILDGFFTRLLNEIQNQLVGSVTTTPQIRAIIALSSAFTLGYPDLGTIEEYFKKYRTFIMCLLNQSKAELNKFIFDLVKKALIVLVLPAAKKILKEKINQYIGIIRSLIGTKT